MIKLKSLINEDIERKYLLPPSGDLFQVKDHVGWTAKNILNKKYGKLNPSQLADNIENVYDDLEKLGYKMLTFAPDSNLYIRGDFTIQNLSPLQRKKIEDLVFKIAEEGIHYLIHIIDDGGHQELLWSHPFYKKDL